MKIKDLLENTSLSSPIVTGDNPQEFAANLKKKSDAIKTAGELARLYSANKENLSALKKQDVSAYNDFVNSALDQFFGHMTQPSTSDAVVSTAPTAINELVSVVEGVVPAKNASALVSKYFTSNLLESIFADFVKNGLESIDISAEIASIVLNHDAEKVKNKKVKETIEALQEALMANDTIINKDIFVSKAIAVNENSDGMAALNTVADDLHKELTQVKKQRKNLLPSDVAKRNLIMYARNAGMSPETLRKHYVKRFGDKSLVEAKKSELAALRVMKESIELNKNKKLKSHTFEGILYTASLDFKVSKEEIQESINSFKAPVAKMISENTKVSPVKLSEVKNPEHKVAVLKNSLVSQKVGGNFPAELKLVKEGKDWLDVVTESSANSDELVLEMWRNGLIESSVNLAAAWLSEATKSKSKDDFILMFEMIDLGSEELAKKLVEFDLGKLKKKDNAIVAGEKAIDYVVIAKNAKELIDASDISDPEVKFDVLYTIDNDLKKRGLKREDLEVAFMSEYKIDLHQYLVDAVSKGQRKEVEEDVIPFPSASSSPVEQPAVNVDNKTPDERLANAVQAAKVMIDDAELKSSSSKFILDDQITDIVGEILGIPDRSLTDEGDSGFSIRDFYMEFYKDVGTHYYDYLQKKYENDAVNKGMFNEDIDLTIKGEVLNEAINCATAHRCRSDLMRMIRKFVDSSNISALSNVDSFEDSETIKLRFNVYGSTIKKLEATADKIRKEIINNGFAEKRKGVTYKKDEIVVKTFPIKKVFRSGAYQNREVPAFSVEVSGPKKAIKIEKDSLDNSED